MVIYKIEHDNDLKVVQIDGNVSCWSRSWLERARTWRKCIVVRTFGQVENQKDTLMVPLLRFRCNYPVFPPILGPSASPGRYQIISRTWQVSHIVGIIIKPAIVAGQVRRQPFLVTRWRGSNYTWWLTLLCTQSSDYIWGTEELNNFFFKIFFVFSKIKSTGGQISKGRTGGIVAKREAGTVRGEVRGGSRGWGEAGISR